MTQKRQTLAEKLGDKLVKLGLTKRKATNLAVKLAPSATRVPVKGTVTGKLTDKLQKLGLTERKAKELAQKLAPTVRAAIKAKAKTAKRKLDDVDDAFVNEIVNEGVDLSEDAELDKVAPRVNGHRVRLDLPVVARSTWMQSPVLGIELLRVIDGYTTNGTYLIASVKGERGMVAVRQLDVDCYNVKFYPDMAYWGKTSSELASLGAGNYLERQWYQRMHFTRPQLDQLLRRLAEEAKPKARYKLLVDRFLTVTANPLIKAFDYLHKRIGIAA